MMREPFSAVTLFAVMAGLCWAQPASQPSRANPMDLWLRGQPESAPAQPAGGAPSGPAGTATGSASAIAPPAGSPVSAARAQRDNRLPGVIQMSDGTLLAGTLRTTLNRNWEVWVEGENRWRHIPPIVVLSIQAVVVEEWMDKEWRWKEMGADERVFTGRERPCRRFLWRFHLIDDSVVTGAVKGQPIWVEAADKTHGPFILQERAEGQFGTTLKDLVYPRAIVVSRRAAQEASRP